MTRLPSSLQPIWPLAKRVHRWSSYGNGVVMRRLAPLQGDRALPRRATTTSVDTAARDPRRVRVQRADGPEEEPRLAPEGRPPGHWVFERARRRPVPGRYSLEIEGGVVVGDYGANLTPDGVLDFETSEYFGIKSWREHPLYLRRRLPPIEDVEGTVVTLATRGGSNNFYHFILDVLPRFGVFQETMPGVEPDGLYVPASSAWQQNLLDLSGLSKYPVIRTEKHRAVRAERLVVPSLPNPLEVAPRATVEWLRGRLPPADVADKPRRIYVTRGTTRNNRTLVHEDATWRLLERRGFTRLDPGKMSIRDQIDHFAAAEVIVAPHGAALTNLVFTSPGVRVLEMFTASYVNAAYWAIMQSIPDARYRYLVAGDAARFGPGSRMNDIMADIDHPPEAVAEAVDALIETD